MNPFSKHPNKKGMSYLRHFKNAFLMGIRLFVSSIFFITHSVFPFIKIPPRYNCHDMIHALVNVARWGK
jgi:hypothetical protein